MTAPRPVITCPICKERRRKSINGWCSACAQRWRRNGRPADGPPPPVTPDEQLAMAWEANRAARAGRVEDYAELTRDFGLALDEAADRMRISTRTAWRYEQTLREQTELSTR